MAAALLVSLVGFRAARRRETPILAARHLWPTRTDIDRRLVGGSVLFGIGWGLVGLCPGPALVNVAGLVPGVLVFVVAMVFGIVTGNVWKRYRNLADAGEPRMAPRETLTLHEPRQ
jgi:uncharacterized membrane protein YedE/YeeE